MNKKIRKPQLLTRRRFLGGMAGAAVLMTASHASALPTLQFRWIAEGVYLHISWFSSSHGVVSSNGLVIVGRDRLLFVDTPCSMAQTEEMLGRILDYEDKRLVITHAHDDRMAGLPVMQARGISSLAHQTTVAAAVERQQGTIDEAWSGETHVLNIGGRKVDLFYPGPAHTSDNTVVYIEDCALLYGACLVRALDRTNLGGLGSADVCHWPQAIRTLQQRYSHARIVVPGHGEPGNLGLLSHTLALAEAEGARLNCGGTSPSP
ncbi:MAG: subclass B1 metallo-beta-lactamase [Sphingomonadales bacterium]|nr:subclass B1 metallo-beta-lactamase [Sphingomonadales bacterium]